MPASGAKSAVLQPAWLRDPLYRAAGQLPSLDLQFARRRDFVNVITGRQALDFTRTSARTIENAIGVVEPIGVNQGPFTFRNGVSLGLDVWGSATNPVPWSEDFSNAAWTKSNATIAANAAVAPDGATTADKMISDGQPMLHWTQSSFAIANATTYEPFIYLKRSEITRADVLFQMGSTLYAQGYDLANGTLLGRVTGGTAIATGGWIERLGNDWYRCGISMVSDGTVGAIRPCLREGLTTTSTMTDQGLFVWGAQFAVDRGPYIPTAGSALSRASDVASSLDLSWFDPAGMLFYLEYATSTDGSRPFQVTNSDTSERIEARVQGGWRRAIARLSGVDNSVDSDYAASVATGTLQKHVIAFTGTQLFSAGPNGIASVPISRAPIANNALFIGSFQGVGSFLNGPIARLAAFPLGPSFNRMARLVAP